MSNMGSTRDASVRRGHRRQLCKEGRPLGMQLFAAQKWWIVGRETIAFAQVVM